MSGGTGGEVRYSRPIPPQWEELHTVVRTEVENSSPPLALAQTVSEYVAENLDADTLDTNRYYGQGLIICGVAQEIQKPDIRTTIVRRMGDVLFRHSLFRASMNHDGLVISDVAGHAMGGAFDHITLAASKALPPETQLLNNVLELEACRRKNIISNRWTADPVVTSKEDYPISDAIEKDLAADTITFATTSAASALFRVVLQKRYRYLIEQEIMTDTAPREPAVASILQHGGLEPLSLQRLGPQVAGLRQDELENLEDLLDVSDDGHLMFRSDRMTPQRRLAPPQYGEDQENQQIVLHTKRQRCPALFVPGMIGFVLDVIPEAVTIADDKLAEVKQRQARLQSDSAVSPGGPRPRPNYGLTD